MQHPSATLPQGERGFADPHQKRNMGARPHTPRRNTVSWEAECSSRNDIILTVVSYAVP